MRSQRFAQSCLPNRNSLNNLSLAVPPTVFLFAAFLLLMLPIRWLLAVVVSAMVHELSHILMIRGLGLRIDSVCVGIGGTRIKTEPMSYPQELLCALAGPVGGLCLLLLARWFPRIAICAAFQSAYNLLPVYPNDGGRILRCVTHILLPEGAAHRLCCCIEVLVMLILAVIGIYGTFWLHLGVLPMVISWVLIIKAVKIPCKPG